MPNHNMVANEVDTGRKAGNQCVIKSQTEETLAWLRNLFDKSGFDK